MAEEGLPLLQLLASAASTAPELEASVGSSQREHRRKDAERKRHERVKDKMARSNSEHKKRREEYLANLHQDRYLPSGFFSPIVDPISELQGKKEFKKIGELINRVTSLRKVITVVGDRMKLDNPNSSWIVASHRGRGKNPLTVHPRTIVGEEWQIHFHDTHIFSIKPSTLKDAGLGLFFAKNVKQGRCIGYAHGKAVPLSNDYTSSYAWRSNALKTIIDPKGGVSDSRKAHPVYFGIHFAKDPVLHDKNAKITNVNQGPLTRRQHAEEIPQFNVMVDSHFWVYTLSDVQKGQEVFVNYGWTGQVTQKNFRINPRN